MTHIGKQVNSLRKREGEVGEKARTLVITWKKLLDGQSSTSARHSCPSSSVDQTLGTSIKASSSGDAGQSSKGHRRSHHRHQNGDGDTEVQVRTTPIVSRTPTPRGERDKEQGVGVVSERLVNGPSSSVNDGLPYRTPPRKRKGSEGS